MTHLDLAPFDVLTHFRRQLQKPEQVADARARTPNGFGSLLVRELELGDQALEGARFFQRVEGSRAECFSMSADGDRGLIRNAADDCRDFREARHLRGSPAAFAGDDLVALRLSNSGHPDRAHNDGLNDALRFYGVGELLQRLGPHVHARLVLTLLQDVERQPRELLIGGRRRRGRGILAGDWCRTQRRLAKQVGESPAEGRFLLSHDRGS